MLFRVILSVLSMPEGIGAERGESKHCSQQRRGPPGNTSYNKVRNSCKFFNRGGLSVEKPASSQPGKVLIYDLFGS